MTLLKSKISTFGPHGECILTNIFDLTTFGLGFGSTFKLTFILVKVGSIGVHFGSTQMPKIPRKTTIYHF